MRNRVRWTRARGNPCARSRSGPASKRDLRPSFRCPCADSRSRAPPSRRFRCRSRARFAGRRASRGAAAPSRAPSCCRCGSRRRRRAVERSSRLARPPDFFLQRLERTSRRRRAGDDVALVREARTRRAFARRTAHRIIFAQRMAFPIVRHLDAAQVGVALEDEAEEIEDLTLGPIGRLPEKSITDGSAVPSSTPHNTRIRAGVPTPAALAAAGGSFSK